MEPGGKPGSCSAGEGPPSWQQQQTGCKPHPAAHVPHRHTFRALHSGVFFTYLIRMGGGVASASQSLGEPLAQRQDASFRQRRLDLVLLAHQGRMRLPSQQLMKPCSCVIVYNHSAQQGSPVSAPTDGVKNPRMPQVLSDPSTACKPPPFLSVMVHNLLPTDGGD